MINFKVGGCYVDSASKCWLGSCAEVFVVAGIGVCGLFSGSAFGDARHAVRAKAAVRLPNALPIQVRDECAFHTMGEGFT
jgi:hypothetical protein